MKHNHPNHILLKNPHDGEWKCFERLHGVPLYAPSYGTPIASGESIDDCIHESLKWGVKRWDIEVIHDDI